MQISRRRLVAGGIATVISTTSQAQTPGRTATLLIDAEFSQASSTSAQAIKLGADIALEDIRASGFLGTLNLQLRSSDNRGVPAIAVDNVTDAAKDPSLIAVMGGKFSPVQIELVPHVSKLGIMLLNPWGSADAITDHGISPSWTFRVSLKDEFAAAAFVREARRRNANRIGLILPRTAWGRSIATALGKHARENNLQIAGEVWYSFGEKSLIEQYRSLRQNGADLIVLVANELEGAILVRELAALPVAERKPVLSHWGITGGAFESLAGEALYDLDWSVIQTFSFQRPRTEVAKSLLQKVQQRLNVSRIAEIESVCGLAHGFDLTWLLAKAVRQAGRVDRPSVRTEMEKLGPFQGAVRNYDRPFTPNRQDALDETDTFFARYIRGNGLVPVDG
jgi:branched-chain amino acid transport system substrate-binding protein